MLKIIIFVAVAVCAYFFALGYKSNSSKAAGLVSGKLAPCPDKPNCVNTEFATDAKHYTPPLDFSGKSPEITWRLLREAVRENGGKITTTEEYYLAAEYRVAIFGFVDDVECRLDTTDFKIHLRSASRVGYSDLGENKKRAEKIASLFRQKIITQTHKGEE